MQDVLNVLISGWRNDTMRALGLRALLLCGYDVAALSFASQPSVTDGYFLVALVWLLLTIAIQPKSSRLHRLLAATLHVCAIVFQWARMTNFFIGGRSIDEAFFHHLRLRDLPELMTFPTYLVISTVILCAHIGLAVWSNGPRLSSSQPVRLGIFCAALAIASISPIGNFVSTYVDTVSVNESYQEAVAHIQTTWGVEVETHFDPIPPADGNLQNLIVLFLESMESNYLDDDVYPRLTPNLSTIAQQSIYLTNLRQEHFTGFTTAGMFVALCGYPFVVNPDEFGNDKMHFYSIEHLPCLGNVLHRLGYHQTFMHASSLEFSGLGSFYSQIGYDEILGKEELGRDPTFEPLQEPSFWGRHDGDILRHALTVAERRHQLGTPFSVTAATIDAHYPGFPGTDCPAYEHDSGILRATHCVDHLVAKFVEEFRASPLYDDTVLVLMGDHLAMRPPMRTKNRRIYAAFIGKDLEPRVIEQAASHYDIAPTILDILGIGGVPFPLSGSLLTPMDRPVPYDVDLLRAFRPLLTFNRSLRIGRDPIVIQKKPPRLRSGNLTRTLSFRNGNSRGWPRDSFHILELTADGEILDESTVSGKNAVKRMRTGDNAYMLTGWLGGLKELHLSDAKCAFGSAYVHESSHIATYKCVESNEISITLGSLREASHGVRRLPLWPLGARETPQPGAKTLH